MCVYVCVCVCMCVDFLDGFLILKILTNPLEVKMRGNNSTFVVSSQQIDTIRIFYLQSI